MGNLGFAMRLYSWWNRFMGLLTGKIAPTPLPYKEVQAFDLQLALLKRGYICLITGVLDQQTREALKKYQSDNGLKPDGMFGPNTWEKLGKL